MPDPGEPGPVTSPPGPARTFHIPTAGGAGVRVDVAVTVARWSCTGCGDTGVDGLLDGLIAAGAHAAQCGRGALSTLLADQLAETRGELARVDGKASTLLALAGGALTIVLALLSRADLSVAAACAGWLTAALVGAGVTLLAAAVRPALNGGYGFVRHAADTGGDATDGAGGAGPGADAERRQQEQRRQLRWLSRTVLRKYNRVRLAVDLLLAGVVAAAVTAALVNLT